MPHPLIDMLREGTYPRMIGTCFNDAGQFVVLRMKQVGLRKYEVAHCIGEFDGIDDAMERLTALGKMGGHIREALGLSDLIPDDRPIAEQDSGEYTNRG